MVLPGLKPPYLLPGGGVGLSVDGAVCAFLFYFIAAASCAPSASPPFGKEESSQKLWDSPQVSCVLDSLIASASDDSTMARLLAVLSQGSGAWLNAVPITTLYPVYTTSINHASTVVKSLLREFLNHTDTPKQGSTIMVASAHISDSIYTCN